MPSEFIARVFGRITNYYLKYDSSLDDKSIKAAIPKNRTKKEMIVDITTQQVKTYKVKKAFTCQMRIIWAAKTGTIMIMITIL